MAATRDIPTWAGLLVMIAVPWAIYHFTIGDNGDVYVPEPAHAARSEKNKQFLWIEESKDAVRGALKDGDSAKFRNVIFHRTADGLPMVCGEVNSRNGFGGYGGFELFIAAGHKGIVVLQEQMAAAEFVKTWKQLCNG
ncbi:MAG: hypothetical protein WA961_14635 [Rhodanobacter sp.]